MFPREELQLSILIFDINTFQILSLIIKFGTMFELIEFVFNIVKLYNFNKS